MGQPKSKRSAMLDPRHRAVLLKEKYRQQMERQNTDAENAETQAVSRVDPLRNGQLMSCGSTCRRHREKSRRSRKGLRPMMRPGMK